MAMWLLSLSGRETIILSAQRTEMTSAVCIVLTQNETKLRQLADHLTETVRMKETESFTPSDFKVDNRIKADIKSSEHTCNTDISPF